MNEIRAQLERTVRDACGRQDFETAAVHALEGYSDEILGFLHSRLGSDGDEVFSVFAEDLWKGLPQFAWRCSLRTWAYTLARNAAHRYKASPHQRAAHNVTLDASARLSALVDRERSRTKMHLRSEVKDRFRALREQLDPDDQWLLVLRVDREMAFRDIAIAMSGDVDMDEATIAREVVRLRKGFERLKGELKRAAEAAGLIE